MKCLFLTGEGRGDRLGEPACRAAPPAAPGPARALWVRRGRGWHQAGVSLDLRRHWPKAESMHFNAVSLTAEDASRKVKGSDFKQTLQIGDADGFCFSDVTEP